MKKPEPRLKIVNSHLLAEAGTEGHGDSCAADTCDNAAAAAAALCWLCDIIFDAGGLEGTESV